MSTLAASCYKCDRVCDSKSARLSLSAQCGVLLDAERAIYKVWYPGLLAKVNRRFLIENTQSRLRTLFPWGMTAGVPYYLLVTSLNLAQTQSWLHDLQMPW